MPPYERRKQRRGNRKQCQQYPWLDIHVQLRNVDAAVRRVAAPEKRDRLANRRQLARDVIPEEELDNDRNVAEERDVGARSPMQDSALSGIGKRKNEAEHGREHDADE